MNRQLFRQRKAPNRKRHGITPEERLHLDVAAFLQIGLRPPAWWSTIGHGSKIGIRERGMLKAKGLKPGVPDILVFRPIPGGTFVLGLELKAKGNTTSEDQASTHAHLLVAGASVRVVRSVEDVALVLRLAGFEVTAAVMSGGGFVVTVPAARAAA